MQTVQSSLGTEQGIRAFEDVCSSLPPSLPLLVRSRPVHLHPVTDNVQCNKELEDKQELWVEDTQHQQEETRRKPASSQGDSARVGLKQCCLAPYQRKTSEMTHAKQMNEAICGQCLYQELGDPPLFKTTTGATAMFLEPTMNIIISCIFINCTQSTNSFPSHLLRHDQLVHTSLNQMQLTQCKGN